MRLTTLLDNTLLIEQHMQSSRNILRESCDGLTSQQRTVVENIYNEFKPLIEASLTADQIKGIFQQLEKQSVEGGKNRTLAGAGVDVAKQANQVINNVGKWLQDTSLVKAFDQKFEQLKAKVSEKFPDLADKTAALGDWVKANPGKSAAVIGVLTAIASLAGGPVGGAIAGQILRGSAELLKGEKLSTAIGKGIKTAALGYLSGKAFEVLGKFVSGMRADSIPFGPEDAGLEQVSYGATRTLTAPGFSSKETIQGFKVLAFGPEADAINGAMDMIRTGQAGGFDMLQKVAREISSPEYRQAMKDIMAGARADQLANDGLMQWINGMAQAGQAISQGAVAASTGSEKKESYYVQTRALSEGQVYLLFDRVLVEAGFLDKIKAGAGKAAGAVAKGAAWAGKQATEKVTSAKLLAAWKLEGSPTDSEALKTFLLNYGGIDAGTIDKVYTDMKLPTGTADTTAMSDADLDKLIDQLDTKQKKEILDYVNQQLRTA